MSASITIAMPKFVGKAVEYASHNKGIVALGALGAGTTVAANTQLPTDAVAAEHGGLSRSSANMAIGIGGGLGAVFTGLFLHDGDSYLSPTTVKALRGTFAPLAGASGALALIGAGIGAAALTDTIRNGIDAQNKYGE